MAIPPKPVFLIGLGLGLVGCTQAEAPSCAPPGSPWIGYDAADMPTMPITVRVADDGRISWNGASIDAQRLPQYLARTRELNPRPTLIFEHGPGLGCPEIVRIRNEMNEFADCTSAGFCSEHVVGGGQP